MSPRPDQGPGLVGPAEREPAARFLVAERQHVLEGVELAALRVAEVLCKNPRFARRVLSTVPTVDPAHALREQGLEDTDLDTPPDRKRSRSMLTAYTLELLDRVVVIHGAGRTDTGVHALRQVAHFHVDTRIPDDRLRHALNAHLPA
ncbi:MAG: hypothetical protein AAFP86_20025, partial [Planctomycetota bacterium]